jgi:hypothetical protein
MSNERVALCFSVITVRQMMAKRLPLHRGNQEGKLPLYLATLTRSEKSLDYSNLSGLSRVIIKAEAYRAQMGLTQCYDC